ncbi:hypothetical protein S2M10_36450 [Sphingomonas sp. S2M10]|jgi:hypothetical protein|nr:hypothetical protein [Sphingomonas sp. S2M10]
MRQFGNGKPTLALALSILQRAVCGWAIVKASSRVRKDFPYRAGNPRRGHMRREERFREF